MAVKFNRQSGPMARRSRAATFTGDVVVAIANCSPALSASSMRRKTPGRRLTAPPFTAAS
mgnify:CR=1 FL=1